jgi:hypothetical protein
MTSLQTDVMTDLQDAEVESPQRIVVGVDGSPLALVALDLAIKEARYRDASLHITYAYPVMASALTGSTGLDYYDQVEAEARELIEGVKAQAPSTEGLDVEWLAVPGNPSEVLIDASANATLLVVGWARYPPSVRITHTVQSSLFESSTKPAWRYEPGVSFSRKRRRGFRSAHGPACRT